jgi:hypothetical protein
VGQRGFEPLTNGYLQLQNFVIPPRVSMPFCNASGARRNTGLYYYPSQFTQIQKRIIKRHWRHVFVSLPLWYEKVKSNVKEKLDKKKGKVI